MAAAATGMLRRASMTLLNGLGDDVSTARRELAALAAGAPERPGLFLRLAFHDAMTWDAGSRTGGANASIRTKQELAHAGNENLAAAVAVLAPVAERHPSLSLADTIQLAAAVVVEAAGGPAIGFEPGRRDSWAAVPQGRLFDPRGCADPAAALRAFAARLDMSLRHVVALAAVHAVARWWPGPAVSPAPSPDRAKGRAAAAPPPRSPPQSPRVPAPPPPTFSNAFFRGVLAGDAPGDAWLLADPETALLVEEYAANEAALVLDYAAAHEELAARGLRRGAAPPPTPAPEVSAVALAAGAAVVVAVGVVAVAAVWRRRRRGRWG